MQHEPPLLLLHPMERSSLTEDLQSLIDTKGYTTSPHAGLGERIRSVINGAHEYSWRWNGGLRLIDDFAFSHEVGRGF